MKPYRGFSFLVLFLCCLPVLAWVIAKGFHMDPLAMDLGNRLSPPGAMHWFGTDELGRDLLARVAVGFYNTVTISIFAFVSSFVIGVFAGGVAGYYYETRIDQMFNWMVSLIYSIPFLLSIVALASLFDRSMLSAYLVLSAVIWVGPARIVRAGTAKAMNSDVVRLERVLGKPEWKIFINTLIPLSIRPAFVFSFKYFPEIVGLEAGLSFIGLGIQPPDPGLGKMIFDGSNYLLTAWWYAFFPALILFVVVLISNALVSLAEKNTIESAG
jgi:peptide/nickel transport system permease protein